MSLTEISFIVPLRVLITFGALLLLFPASSRADCSSLKFPAENWHMAEVTPTKLDIVITRGAVGGKTAPTIEELLQALESKRERKEANKFLKALVEITRYAVKEETYQDTYSSKLRVFKQSFENIGQEPITLATRKDGKDGEFTIITAVRDKWRWVVLVYGHSEVVLTGMLTATRDDYEKEEGDFRQFFSDLTTTPWKVPGWPKGKAENGAC